MSQLIQIKTENCIGTGDKAWLVTGRIPGDDDDTARIVLADDEIQATDVFSEQLYADSGMNDEDISRVARNHDGSSIYIITCEYLS